MLGSIIILLSNTLETFVCYLKRRFRRHNYARLEWATIETLQLQRLANEEIGFGTWNGCCDAVPVTDSATECLAVLDVSDPSHPRLKTTLPSHDELGANESSMGDEETGGLLGDSEDWGKTTWTLGISEIVMSKLESKKTGRGRK